MRITSEKYRLMFSYAIAPFLYELWKYISWHDFSDSFKVLVFNVQLLKYIKCVISVASPGFVKFVCSDFGFFSDMIKS